MDIEQNELEVKTALFKDYYTILREGKINENLKIRPIKASEDDFRKLHLIEGESFVGQGVTFETKRQILSEGKGRGYFAEVADKAVGYILLEFEPLDERRIDQDLLLRSEIRLRGEPRATVPKYKRHHLIIQDHHFKRESNEVYVNTIGVSHRVRNKGIAKRLLTEVRDDLKQEGKSLFSMLIRINNPESLGLVNNVLGAGAIAIQEPSPMGPILGSADTNYVVKNNIVQDTSVQLSNHDYEKIWRVGQPTPEGPFLLFMLPGEENYIDPWIGKPVSSVVDPRVKDMLKKVMAVGRDPMPGKDYIMVGVSKINRSGMACYSFTKAWNYKKDK